MSPYESGADGSPPGRFILRRVGAVLLVLLAVAWAGGRSFLPPEWVGRPWGWLGWALAWLCLFTAPWLWVGGWSPSADDRADPPEV